MNENAENEKSIVIAVTGSIAAYKACDLVRSLVRKDYSVQVIMTGNAERFISPTTFSALTGKPAYSSCWEEGMAHIDMKNIAGVFGVVPATANIIGKMAGGIADDLLSTSYLAMICPVVVAPAMNPAMFASRPVQRNLRILEEDGATIVQPEEGTVVCGDTGRGKIAPVDQIEKILIEKYEQFINSKIV